MADCTLQITFWSLISVLITIIIMYLLYKWYINNLETEIKNNINQYFINFCNELTPATYREDVYIPYKNGVYEKTLAVALLDIAFNTTKASCSEFPLPNPPAFTEQLRVEGKDPNTGNMTMFAYIFWDKELAHAVISFTGTATSSELLSDFEYAQVAPIQLNNYQNGVLMHQGFYNIYISVRDKLWDWWNSNSYWIETLYITGHSLGGALSTICAFDFAKVFSCVPLEDGSCNYPIHYSFAAPRSGNPKYAHIFNDILPTSLRVNNTCDIVPQLPPASWKGYIYEESGGNIPFTIALPTLKDDHITAYYDGLPDCAQVSPCYLESLDRICCDCSSYQNRGQYDE